ncbi:hypothetical protein BH09ACT10_BH09ACT10_23920 [soil metagenome]
MDTFAAQSGLLLIISLVMFVIKVFALVDAVARDGSKFAMADTLPKKSWLIILSIVVLAHALTWDPLGILNLIGIVAALVYLAQVRGSTHY